MTLAFYCPMKSPLHAVPSGDRQMARNLLKILKSLFNDVELASDFSSYDSMGDPSHQKQCQKQANILISQLKTKKYQAWVTYHLYHKSHDWLGPAISQALNIPYYIIEASYAKKQENGPWHFNLQQNKKAFDLASKIFYMSKNDKLGLEVLNLREKLRHLPPFIDIDDIQENHTLKTPSDESSPLSLITTAMMRHGDKFTSYKILARTLEHLNFDNWTLQIIGSGIAEKEVQSKFHKFEDRVHFLGDLNSQEIYKKLSIADLFVWPAIAEAYGLAIMEAQACGCPVIIGNSGGTKEVILDKETGFLLNQDHSFQDGKSLAQKINFLAKNRDQISVMGQRAKFFISQDHSIDTVSQILKQEIVF